MADETVNIDYVKSEVEGIGRYLDAELTVLKEVKYYGLASKFLDQLSNRVLDEVKSRVGDISGLNSKPTQKELYLNRVSELLESRSHYDPLAGSFWEDVGDTLKNLSSRVKSL